MGQLVWMFAIESEAEIWTFFPIALSPAGSLVVDWVSESGSVPLY